MGYRYNFFSGDLKKIILIIKDIDFKGEKDLEFKNIVKSKDGVDFFVFLGDYINYIFKLGIDKSKLIGEK